MVSHHRELKNAQAELIEAARAWRIMVSGVSPLHLHGPASALVLAVDQFNRVAANLDASGGAGRRQTSVIAAKTTLPTKGSLRRNIIYLVTAHHTQFGSGMITAEICKRLRKEHQNVSSQINYLEASGWLKDSGQRRNTPHGKPAIVWVPTDLAVEKVRESSLGAA